MKAMIALTVVLMTSHGLASSTNQNESTQNIIVRTKGSFNFHSLSAGRSSLSSSPIIDEMNIHLLKTNPTIDSEALLKELRNNPEIAYAQFDHVVTMREATAATAEPNDPDFIDQWSMSLSPTNYGIDALTAWLTYGTGGKDANNNDIVVAVVDGGVEITHPDLEDNIWINEGEIPGNNIDDDLNGYVDDINGWNGYTNSGQQKAHGHGTHVAGIVGARGNNNNQVTGVNWDVKLMNVPGSSGNTSVVLTAYKYVLDQKKLWLSSNGQLGANIVSTNSSFGIDNADCNSKSFAAWNDIYNEMGKVGILSAAATANAPVDIDLVGDVPTGCDSPYLIAVTNNLKNGKRASAGYGNVSIDLAAPGTNIVSTYSNGQTASLTGTSMATPHVAGAIAFMNSVASLPLATLALTDPSAAALELKRMLLETVTPAPSMADETVSGGILNLNQAAAAAVNFGMGEADDSEVEEESTELLF